MMSVISIGSRESIPIRFIPGFTVKATGAAGDITLVSQPVDGTFAVSVIRPGGAAQQDNGYP